MCCTLVLAHALVNNIHASPKDILIELSIHSPMTMECTIGLTVGGVLQMLLLLCVLCPSDAQ